MQYFRSIWRIIHLSLLSTAVLISSQAIGFAQDGPLSGGGGGGSWVWAYMIVVLATALGMIVVCKSSRRRDTIRPLVYEDLAVKKTLLKD
ncbi:MAG TPA: hypothetical protein VIH42_01725 [Thermoguttaceae bacterium]